MQKLGSLTGREREVLALLTTGRRSKELALQLGVSPRTVQKHLQRIYAKLGVGGRTAAALIAVQSAIKAE